MATSIKKMSRAQIERHIRAIAADTSNVFLTVHARNDSMRKRKVNADEVFHCLQTGRVLIPPEEDMKTGHLICRMECYGASRNLAVCVALDDNDPTLIVVTVITKKA